MLEPLRDPVPGGAQSPSPPLLSLSYSTNGDDGHESRKDRTERIEAGEATREDIFRSRQGPPVHEIGH